MFTLRRKEDELEQQFGDLDKHPDLKQRLERAKSLGLAYLYLILLSTHTPEQIELCVTIAATMRRIVPHIAPELVEECELADNIEFIGHGLMGMADVYEAVSAWIVDIETNYAANAMELPAEVLPALSHLKELNERVREST